MTKKAEVVLMEEEREKKRKKNPIGADSEFINVLEKIKKIANYNNAILLKGETGTGKTFLAEYIHKLSGREKFIQINCGSFNSNLLETELFGHLKGSFTGAISNAKGKLLEADGGTLFLDEIGDMPPEMQIKFLTVIENGEFFPVGSVNKIKSNFRLIAASNKNLNECLREDLRHRIGQFEIEIPPLRKRPKDIEIFFKFFLEKLDFEYKQNTSYSKPLIKKLKKYHWPGNIRELRNIAEKAFILCDGGIIKEADINIPVIGVGIKKKSEETNDLKESKNREEEYGEKKEKYSAEEKKKEEKDAKKIYIRKMTTAERYKEVEQIVNKYDGRIKLSYEKEEEKIKNELGFNSSNHFRDFISNKGLDKFFKTRRAEFLENIKNSGELDKKFFELKNKKDVANYYRLPLKELVKFL